MFLADNTTTVQDILHQILSKLGVLDISNNLPYFGIFESKNGASIDGNFGLEMLIFDILEIWNENGNTETAKFLFMIRLHLPCLWGLQLRDVVAFRLNKPQSVISLQSYVSEAEVIDVNLLHLQFIHAVYQVITGRYPTTRGIFFYNTSSFIYNPADIIVCSNFRTSVRVRCYPVFI